MQCRSGEAKPDGSKKPTETVLGGMGSNRMPDANTAPALEQACSPAPGPVPRGSLSARLAPMISG